MNRIAIAASMALAGAAAVLARNAAASSAGSADEAANVYTSPEVPYPVQFAFPDLSSLFMAPESTQYYETQLATQYSDATMNANLAAFLMAIRNAEGTAGADGYHILFGGQRFESLADHPNIRITAQLGGRSITSTAAGAYQILYRTWTGVKARLGLTDFSESSQDAAAIELIRQRGALEDARAGNFDRAVAKCANEWASLPGSPYGQPTVQLAALRSIYESAGGSYA